MDRAIRPGDDFYAYTNGGWMKTTEIPADRAGLRLVHPGRRDGGEADGGPHPERRKGGCPDRLVGRDGRRVSTTPTWTRAEIEKRGLSPLKAELDAIAAISDQAGSRASSATGCAPTVDALNCTDFYTDRPLGLWAAPGFADASRYVPYLLQGGLGMPDRGNYLNTDAKAVELQAKYKAHVVAVLKLASVP